MFKHLDWYRKMMMGIIPFSFTLLLYLLFSHSSELLPSEWILDLVTIPAFVGAQISSAGYLGRGMDSFSSQSSLGRFERIGTLVGLFLGLTAGITLAIVSEVIPFAKPLGAIAHLLFALGSVSVFAGLGNRIGQCVDQNERPSYEKKAIGLSATLGLFAGIALFAAKCAVMVSVVGVSSFLTGGAALPLWIAGAVFVASFSSSCASSADYTAKAFSFLKSSPIVNKRLHEYRGSFAGVSTGLIVAGIIIGAIALSQPYLLAGFVGIVAGVMIVSACVSLMGGLFSRVGRIMDAKKTVQPELRNVPSLSSPKPLLKPEITSTFSPHPERRPSLQEERDRVSVAAMIALRARATSCPTSTETWDKELTLPRSRSLQIS